MADKKKPVSDQELAQAMDKAWKNSEKDQENVQVVPVEEPNKRMDVFPELLAKKPRVSAQPVPTYGQIVPQGICQNRACKINVAKILAMKEAEEKLEKRRRERREERRKAAETAAIILMSVGLTVACFVGAVFLTRFM